MPSNISWFVVCSLAGLLRKYALVHSAVLAQIPSHCAHISALGQILSCSRAMMRIFVEYRNSQYKDKRRVTCLSDLKNLRRSARKLEAHKMFQFVPSESRDIHSLVRRTAQYHNVHRSHSEALQRGWRWTNKLVFAGNGFWDPWSELLFRNWWCVFYMEVKLLRTNTRVKLS